MLPDRKGHVIEHRHVGEQGSELEQHAHAPAQGIELGLFHGRHFVASHPHLARRRAQLPANQVEQRRLAAAGAPHDGHHLALGKTHVDSREDGAIIVGKVQIANFDETVGGHGRKRFQERRDGKGRRQQNASANAGF
ncbi:hypothetical protein SDC9_194825 [bioreactor metagenome]|uniref:Uncharacterized protein n=1 Tax=bioreactor metagenome TaxID=1076179 RepID=A0A645IG01_9ZZZZ